MRGVIRIGAWLTIVLALGWSLVGEPARARGQYGPCPTPGWPCPPAPQVAPAPAPQAIPTPAPKPEEKKPIAPEPIAPKQPDPAPQPPASPSTDPSTDSSSNNDSSAGETLAMFESSVGYIDTAIPGNQFRLRYDDAFRNNRPNRAEFFYAKGAPTGPGLPFPEVSVDYQDLMAYTEYAFAPRFSTFVELGARFLDPVVNANQAGLADMNTGFKYAFQLSPQAVSTFQFKTFIPSGNANRGLGTAHVSLEPGLLFYRQLDERLRFESELRYWAHAGGTDFAGDVIRYGVGLSYGERPTDRFWISPVTELVGWTVVSGKETEVFFPGAAPLTQEAGGDTIVNAKVGVRAGMGNRANLYVGYGRALTGEVWYKDLVRVELRLFY